MTDTVKLGSLLHYQEKPTTCRKGSLLGQSQNSGSIIIPNYSSIVEVGLWSLRTFSEHEDCSSPLKHRGNGFSISLEHMNEKHYSGFFGRSLRLCHSFLVVVSLAFLCVKKVSAQEYEKRIILKTSV